MKNRRAQKRVTVGGTTTALGWVYDLPPKAREEVRRRIDDRVHEIPVLRCLEWVGPVDDDQQLPIISLCGHWVFVARVLWILQGHTPSTVYPALHRWCVNKLCVNPKHLVALETLTPPTEEASDV